MIFSNKKSFFVPFFAVFFGAMVIMGFAQAIVGTLRWYNPSEEEHEKLGTSQTYIAKKTPEKPHLISLFIPQPTSADIGTYFSAHNDDIQSALQTVAPDKAQKIVVRIEQIKQNTDIAPQIIPPVSHPFETPVVLQVRPDSATFPR